MKKREMLEIIAMLMQVNDVITKNYRGNSRKDLTDALSQCQETALALGNNLETIGEQGEAPVHILEDYCENLYQMSLSFDNKNSVKKLSNDIKGQLINLEKKIRDFPNGKIKMVFLPYKVSMWDSLESVWRAAAEDPECDAYVVPIPYYERNSKGELAIERYEGGQFPESIPVVHYLDFSLPEQRPDVVFVHNPYDQYNLVTSVHPMFYVEELKKYVDKVAYIPYYISAEDDPDNKASQQQKQDFVLTPGVIQSDMVFVQSDSMKRLYVNVLEKNFPEPGRKYWEEKIHGLGSPKLDRVHMARRDDSLLSPHWRSLILDQEGARKDVVLYNTSLVALLKHDDMLDKIADTLAFFEKHRDIVLWWRPHPLYESTLSSMRPDALKTYQKIVERYKSEAWGVFDSGEDLEWAIAETDRYYGDRSSVVQLYLHTGKPVLLQNTQVQNSVHLNTEIPVWPCAFWVDEDDVWFVHGKLNLLMRFYKSDKTVTIIGSVPGEDFFQESLYEAIYKEGNKIYLIPCWAREIAIYDINDHRFTKIKLDNIDNYENILLFCKCFAAGRSLYCIPYSYKAIVQIDFLTHEVVYHDLPCTTGTGGNIYVGGAVFIKDKIICLWNRSNELISMDLKNHDLALMEAGETGSEFTKIGGSGDRLVLYDSFTKDIRIKSSGDVSPKSIINMSDNVFQMHVVSGDVILADMADSGRFVGVDYEGNVRCDRNSQRLVKKKSLESSFCCGVMSNQPEMNYYFDVMEYMLYAFDKNGVKEKYNFRDEKVNIAEIEALITLPVKLECEENDLFSLEKWLSNDCGIRGADIKAANAGEQIKNRVKEILNGECNIQGL